MGSWTIMNDMKCIIKSRDVQEVIYKFLLEFMCLFWKCDTTKHVLYPQMKSFRFSANSILAINAINQIGEIAIIIFAFPRLMTLF